MEEIDNGAIELRTPPYKPPFAWYEDYLRGTHSRIGVPWKAIRDGLKAADAGIKTWAGETNAAVVAFLDGLASRAPLSAPAPQGLIRNYGALLGGESGTNGESLGSDGASGGGRQAAMGIDAAVIGPKGTTTGTVRFEVIHSPRITSDGRFEIDLSTDADGYDDYTLLCTLRGAHAAVCFAGTIMHRPGDPLREVRIDEADLPGPSQLIPLDRLELTILEA
jgi:hypothetical protein